MPDPTTEFTPFTPPLNMNVSARDDQPSLTDEEVLALYDADREYRKRLAEIVLAIRAKGPADQDLTNLLKEICIAVPFTIKENASYNTPQQKLTERFRRRPDLQGRIALFVQYTNSKWLLERELIAQGHMEEASGLDAYQVASLLETTGLCLSGGGIRSATFNLGILQGLARRKALDKFTYLSSVSGGGYIHQFLAAWLFRIEDRKKLEDALNPIPNERATSPAQDPPSIQTVVAPEPIRWLRRYSNYLSPTMGFFSADMWTIAAVWIRNTLLNLVILLSFLASLLLAPHFFVTGCMLLVGSRNEPLLPVLVLLISFSIAIRCLYVAFPRFDDAERDKNGKRTPPPPNSTPAVPPSNWFVYVITVCLLLVALLLSPYLYRAAVPGGSAHSCESNDAYKQVTPLDDLHFTSTYNSTIDDRTKSRLEDLQLDVHEKKSVPETRLHHAWANHRPRLIWPVYDGPPGCPCSPLLENLRPANWQVWHEKLALHRLDNLVWPVAIVPLGCFAFCYCLLLRIKERSHRATKQPSLPSNQKKSEREKLPRRYYTILAPSAALLLAAALLHGIRLLFFIATFTVPQELIPRLGVVLLPTLLLAVPFICLELTTGLLGRLLGSAQREWVARLRAQSFLAGSSWLFITGMSLLGPYLFDWIAKSTAASYATLGTWIVSSISGVLLGKSRKTNGKAKDASAGSSTPAFLNSLELVTLIAPPIFVLGLVILISKLVNLALTPPVDHAFLPPDPFLAWLGTMLGLAATAVLFGLRIDVNDFSMNTFYRDRLARCYAGASNFNRNPNQFTGFDFRDGSLRVTDLLPTGWKNLPGTQKWLGPAGTYAGPFPIFCTSVNLTTGKDLAYQERKAGSFAITPLFSGYSTGWTDAVDATIRYNGFVPTFQHIKRGSRGITVASAVAISGAAASPNMGYHSSMPMAFLMTIFNVRLGWWLRNTRRLGSGEQSSRLRSSADSPRFGMLALLKELAGHTDDTSRYLYLSDGGHFDNMGLYELLRRRCRTIVICDAEADKDLCFEGIGMAIRKARIDFGIEVTLKNLPAVPGRNPSRGNPSSTGPAAAGIFTTNSPATAPTSGSPSAERPSGAEGVLAFAKFPGNSLHAIEGQIVYPELPGKPGKLLYIKSTLTGNEPADVLNYHRIHNAFPFDSTLDQFFTESQFESYRRLGEHIILEDQQVKRWLDKNLKPQRKPSAQDSSQATASVPPETESIP